MSSRIFSSIMMFLLVISTLTLAFKIQIVNADGGTIYINADGSITPPTAPIYTADNITYTLAGNINGSIVVERDNIVLEGAGYTVTGGGSGNGITSVSHMSLTVRNMAIANFTYGIYLEIGSVTVSGNTFTGGSGIWVWLTSNDVLSDNTFTGGTGIFLDRTSNDVLSDNTFTGGTGIFGEYTVLETLSGNNFTGGGGIGFAFSENNTLSGNNFTGGTGIVLESSLYNVLYCNTFTNINYGIYLGSIEPQWPSSSNSIFHNSFVNNTNQPSTDGSTNTWDDGYPSGGNYWSDYATRYPDAAEIDNSGLWNTPYTIGANNTDRYPLMFPYTAFITVKSEYSGYFVQNLPLNNTFGVYTSHNTKSPVNVYGNLSDIEGSRIVRFSNATDPSGAHLSDPVDMGSLSLNAILQVFAVYSDGTILNETCPLKVIPTPSWLISILNGAHLIKVENQTQAQWDNTYRIHVEKELDLSGIFNITIPLPTFAGGGNYTLLPSVAFGFSFYSNGTCTISSNGIGESVPIQFGVASVTAHINVTVTGTIALENNSITWVSASFSLDVGTSTSVNIPIVGDDFGGVSIGLSARVTFNADFGATIVLAPTENNSEELISGIGIMIQSITGKISFGAGIAVKASIMVASVTGGGDIEVNVYLQATQPYIYKFTVIGTVSIHYQVLWWSRTLWSETGTLYKWSDGAGVDPDPTNFTVTARYYNTSDYEEFTWTNGSFAGIGRAPMAMHNIYPLTRISATSSGDTAYILYTDDNVSMPVQSGLCWTGLEFNSSQGTLGSLSLPAISNEIFFSPVVISLPNGSLLAMWDSIPLSEANNATDPLDINTVIPQYSCFDTNTRSWGPIENLVKSGVATSYSLSSDSAGCYALVLQGGSLFSNNQSLVEYDLQSGSELLSISTTHASNIVSFDRVSSLAVLQMLDGSYELLNLSSSQLVNLPSMEGCQVKIVQLATNSTDSVGVLYSSNATSDIFSIYNISSGTISFSMNVSQSTNSLTLIQLETSYQLVTTDSSGITSYLIKDQTETDRFYPLENITSMGATETNNGILVCTTENYGNSSYPLLNLTLTYINTLVGDINGPNGWPDGKVDMRDIGLVARHFGEAVPPAPSVCDMTGPTVGVPDGKIDMRDIGLVARHFGDSYTYP